MFKKLSFKTGLSFGLTSAIITTLGLMVGLYSTTNSKIVVIAGILTIAIADAFSDALGIHISEESKDNSDSKHVWESTVYTFICKLIFALLFIIPVLIFDSLKVSMIASIIWGGLLLSILSYFIAKQKKEKPLNVIAEHIVIGALVIVLADVVGKLVNKYCC